MVALSKDLQADFYPKFPLFFARFVDLLQTKEPQIIEWTFTTLAFLYKYLWRALVKDIDRVYELQLPLLAANKPEHIQLFASESFAFIGRKITNKPSFVSLIFTKLVASPKDSLGVGQLLFQVIKGVKNQFHSNLDLYLPLYFKAVVALEGCVQDDPVFKAVEHCLLLMARHTTADFSTQVWKLLLAEVGGSKLPGLLGMLLILKQWVSFREGTLIGDIVAIANTLAAMTKHQLNENEQQTAAETTAAVMLCAQTKLPLEQFSRLGLLIYSCRWHLKAVLDFSTSIASHELFESHLLPHYLSFCHSITELGPNEHDLLLESLCRLIARKTSFPKAGHEVANYKLYPMEFTFAMRKTSATRSVPHVINGVLGRNLEELVNDKFKLLVSALVCLPNIRPVDEDSAKNLLKRIFFEIVALVEAVDAEAGEPQSKRAKTCRPSDFLERLGFISNLVMLNISHFARDMNEFLPWQAIEKILVNDKSTRNVFFLRAVDFYLTALHQSGHEELFTFEWLSRLYKTIGENISSPYHEVNFFF